jgi:hypothetical protein
MRFDPSTSSIRPFPRSAISRYPGSGPVGGGGTGTGLGEPVVECVEPAEAEFPDVGPEAPRVQLAVTTTTRIRPTAERRIRQVCATESGSVQQIDRDRAQIVPKEPLKFLRVVTSVERGFMRDATGLHELREGGTTRPRPSAALRSQSTQSVGFYSRFSRQPLWPSILRPGLGCRRRKRRPFYPPLLTARCGLP